MHIARLKMETKAGKGATRDNEANPCWLLGLALLEMAGFVLCGPAPAGLVSVLLRLVQYSRDQRFLLLMADRRECSCLATPAGRQGVRLYVEGL